MNSYPYADKFINNKLLFKLFERLKKEKTKETLENLEKIKKLYFVLNWYHYEKISLITDYFTEECRVKCRFIGKAETPLDYFNKNKKELIEKSYVNNKFSIKKFREVIYYSQTKYCNKFNIIVAYYVYQIFKPKNVLDSSAGWGDRMIAAMAYGCDYQGYDPSECLESKYKKIIKTLIIDKNQKKYNVIKKPFEEVTINTKYDLAFTSPPFFDVETYEKTKHQSLEKFPNLDQWIKDFLLVLVEKNIKALKKGGHLVIYVPSYPLFIEYMKNNKSIKYLGKIIYQYEKIKVFREIGVWKKIR